MVIRKNILQPFAVYVILGSFLISLAAGLLLSVYKSLLVAENSLRPALALTVFVDGNINEPAVLEWEKRARAHDSQITSIEFVSKEQAYHTAAQDSEIVKALMLLKDNPLPASFLIHFQDTVWLSPIEPSDRLRNMPSIIETRSDAQAQTIFRRLHDMRHVWGRVIVAAGMGLVLWFLNGFYRFLSTGGIFSDGVLYLIWAAFGSALAFFVEIEAIHYLPADLGFFRLPILGVVCLLFGVAGAMAMMGLSLRR